jgi:tripartite-type tricarboxylate transporter receptor subunit TctC
MIFLRKNLTSTFLILASFLIAIASSAFNAVAQDYPVRPIKLIVPFAPGGGNDAIARFIARNLSSSLGQPVVVDNRAGAGGRTGVESGVKAEPDGYTLTLISNSYAANPSLYAINFDPINDISAIGMIAKTPLLVAIRSDLPVKNVAELIAFAKSSPHPLSYASSGLGGISHLSTELFIKSAGIEMTHIPYKGTSPALTDLVGHVTDVFFSTTGAASPYMKAKKIRVLAVTTSKRSVAEPDIPTVSESGLSGYEVTVWYGLIAPKNLNLNVIQLLNKHLNSALTDPKTLELFKTTGDEATPTTPAEFKKQIDFEVNLWRKVVASSKIKLDNEEDKKP